MTDDGEMDTSHTSWLAVDVAELEQMDTSAGKRHLDALQIPHDYESADKKGRGYIYDESPTSREHSTATNTTAEPFSAPVNAVSPPSSTPTATAQVDHSYPVEATTKADPEPKISFMNFNVGSIALFIPTDNAKKIWMAFHCGKPNHFLEARSLYAFTHRGGQAVDKSRILARITRIVVHRVPEAAPVPGLAMDGTAAATAGIGGGGGDSQVYNPYRLRPGTVFYECHAEPVTVIKHA